MPVIRNNHPVAILFITQRITKTGMDGICSCYSVLIDCKESNLKIRRIALVHGEEEQSLAFAETLHGEGYSVLVPRRGETVQVT